MTFAPGQVYVWRLIDGTYFFRIRLVSAQGIQGDVLGERWVEGVCNFWWAADGKYPLNSDYDLRVRPSRIYLLLRGVTP